MKKFFAVIVVVLILTAAVVFAGGSPRLPVCFGNVGGTSISVQSD